MSVTKIYNTELNQGKNELNNIRQSLAGKWGNDSLQNYYTGNLVHSVTTSGKVVTNSSGSSSGCILIVCFMDASYTIISLDKDESRAFDKEIKIAVMIGIQ